MIQMASLLFNELWLYNKQLLSSQCRYPLLWNNWVNSMRNWQLIKFF